MKRIYSIFLILIPVVLLGLAVNNTDLGSRVRRKIQTILPSFKSHPLYIPVPATVSQESLDALSLQKISSQSAKVEPTLAKPSSHYLSNLHHQYQTWNNCGPATLSMTLGFFGLPQTQKDIAPFVKPDPEDKNVSPQELVEYVQKQTTLKVIYTFNADLLKLKLLNSNNIPVMVETWYEPHPNDGMGHYQLVEGYDESKKEFSLFDSFKGPHISISEDKLDGYWKAFNRTILVIYPKEKEEVVKKILGESISIESALPASLENAKTEIAKDQNDTFAWFNLGTTYSLMGKHTEAASAFDKARTLNLPWRMLWYQFRIFDSYLAVDRFQDVYDLTTLNLRQANNLEESLYYRARAERQLDKKDQARLDLKQALKYNKFYTKAEEELRVL